MNDDTYLLVCKGKRYTGISLDEVRRILIDEGHHSFAYVKHLMDKVAHRDG